MRLEVPARQADRADPARDPDPHRRRPCARPATGSSTCINAEPDLEVVAEAADGAEAVEHALADDIDLAILDISMPRMTGLQAARELSHRRPELRLLILSMYDNEQFLFEALKAGASGYVLKSGADDDIVDACRAAMRGQSFLYPSAVSTLVRDFLERGGKEGDYDPLTPARARGAEADRRRQDLEGDRRAARAQHQDGRAPPRRHPRTGSACATASTSPATRSAAG